MEIDKKLKILPLTKSKPSTLKFLFGKTDIQPMWVADMEFEVAKPIQEALIQRVSDSGFGYEYKPDSFFSAQEKWYLDRYGIKLNRSELVFSPSITTSISVVIENFTSKGDGIIIQPPVYMEFKDVIRNTGRLLTKNPLKSIDGHYQIDFQDLEKKAKLKHNKMLIICNPHNPVGRVWTKEELNQVVKICKENDLLLISDEIHKDIILFSNTFNSLMHFNEDYEKIIVCTSEAKTFNLCGISDSMAMISSESIKNTISKTLQKYNLGRTNALTRVALEAAYCNGQDWLNNVLQIIEENISTISKELESSRITFTEPEGTYQVWLNFEKVFSDTKEMFDYVTNASGVGLNAGHWFGREGALFMRMNIATSNKKVRDAIRKIEKSIPDG